jgi:hypothetical protein
LGLSAQAIEWAENADNGHLCLITGHAQVERAQLIESLLLITAVVCAIPYGITFAILIWSNPKNRAAWLILAGALISWPLLFFMCAAQLGVVIPFVTVWTIDGRDISKPISIKAACWATGLTLGYFAIMAIVGVLITNYVTNH